MKTHRNIKRAHFVHTLAALLAKHKLTKDDDEFIHRTYAIFHDIYVIQDPTCTDPAGRFECLSLDSLFIGGPVGDL